MWAAIYMLIAAPFLLPRGAGVRGARKLWRRLRRRADEVEEAEESSTDFFVGEWSGLGLV